MPDYQVKNVEPVAVGADVQVRVFTLTDGEEIPWHYHSESTDHYFVLRGKLTIETRSPHHRHQLDVGERSARHRAPHVSFCLSKEWASMTGRRLI